MNGFYDSIAADSGSVFYQPPKERKPLPGEGSLARYQRPITKDRHDLKQRSLAYEAETHLVVHAQANVMNPCRMCKGDPDPSPTNTGPTDG